MSVDYEEDYYHHSNWEDVRCGNCDYLFGTAPRGTHKSMLCESCEWDGLSRDLGELLGKSGLVADWKVPSDTLAISMINHLQSIGDVLRGIKEDSEEVGG